MKLSLYLDSLRPTSSPDQLDSIGPAPGERRVGRAAVFF